jgi:hypothetical protein
MSDMRNYALAEAADASSKCPAAYSDYNKALQILDTYATFAGTALEITYVELARQAILEARNTWYAVGCSDPKVSSPEPSSPPSGAITPAEVPGAVVAAMGFGNIGQFLLVGGALFAAMLVFSKKPPKGRGRKPAKRRVVRRRRR